jgi:hypothetical protein
MTIALIIGGFALKGDFFYAFGQFRIMLGGKEEAGRITWRIRSMPPIVARVPPRCSR